MYAARMRNGFTPRSRLELFRKLKGLEIAECSFANLPEKHAGRWGAGLTAAKMAECRWMKPVLVAQFRGFGEALRGHVRNDEPAPSRPGERANAGPSRSSARNRPGTQHITAPQELLQK